jgi:dTDP-4-dehydrorhamnose reductase
MQVWLVGAGGMLAQAVRAQFEAFAIPYVPTDSSLDIAQLGPLQAFADAHAFTHVINCAAFTKVDGCETQEAQAMAVNAVGAGNVGQVAASVGARALHVSTDYVFAGDGTAPYEEDAPCAPLGVYGRSKHQGEQRFLAAFAGAPGGTAGLVVRTSWLFGHGGPNFVATMLRLMQARDTLGVVADQVGRPTYCPDLAAAMLQLLGLQPTAGGADAAVATAGTRTDDAAAATAPAGIYHFANSEQTSWHGFACEILAAAKQVGVPMRCQSVSALRTQDYPTPAKRPAYSVLSTEKVRRALGYAPRPWQAALHHYMEHCVYPTAGTPQKD